MEKGTLFKVIKEKYIDLLFGLCILSSTSIQTPVESHNAMTMCTTTFLSA